MLNGQVFSNQLFESHIFALFVNTFLGGVNGIAENYKNGMAVTYSGSNISINTGAVVIQGRYLEEDTGITINAGTDALYCKLVIEIDLDKINAQNEFRQGYYSILTDSSSYPTLIQTDIVDNVSGIYQFELAQFRTTSSGITEFVDKRTFVDIDGLYETLQNQYADDIGDLSQLQTTDKTSLVNAINEVIDKMYPIGSIYMSVSSTNPSSYFGGTWVNWGQGKVPVGVSSDTEFNTVEKTGGEKTHTLTIDEMPEHNHAATNTAGYYLDSETGSQYALVNGNKARGFKFVNKGGSQSHNNLQPYITCYMFKRTA